MELHKNKFCVTITILMVVILVSFGCRKPVESGGGLSGSDGKTATEGDMARKYNLNKV